VTATTTGVGVPGHAIIGGSSASVPLLVARSVSGGSSSRRSDSKSTTSTTNSVRASEDVDIDIDIDINVDGDEVVDSHRDCLHRLRTQSEQDIEVDVEGMEEEGDVDKEEGRGVVSVLPISRLRWGGSSTRIRFKGVLRATTTTVMRSRLTTACMELRLLLGTRTGIR